MLEKEGKKGKFYKLKVLAGSASFALVLSLIIFLYQEISTKRDFMRVVDNLTQIENSLSTRYLGIFPEYIKNINTLLGDVILEQKTSEKRDSVIIFEDVLYYGIRSDAEGFKNMLQNLITIANNGSHITIAYYDVKGQPFNQMLRDELISNKYQDSYRRDVSKYFKIVSDFRKEGNEIRKSVDKSQISNVMHQLVIKHFSEFCDEYAKTKEDKTKLMSNFMDYHQIESLICQRYFDSTKVENKSKFISSVKSMLKELPYKKSADGYIEARVNTLMKKLDEVKRKHLDKHIDLVTYADYANTYKELTLSIIEVLSENGNIEMIPLNENLMMSCWMHNSKGQGKAIFAFPSKYSTEEIGFVSQDIAFIRYINTMLNGVKVRVNKK